ncbi:MAG: hypothetical protein D6706_07925, partial [Chloroflexi bacterium]
WAQADLLDYLSLTSFGVWAPLIYMLAWIGALVMIAIGQPPRQYLWFVIGPAIYHWLIDTRTPVTGVQWAVGYVDQDQREVWRLAETGLASSNLVNRLMYQWPPQGYVKVFSNATPVLLGVWSGPYAQYKSPHGDGGDRRPTEIAAVSTAFLWFDELVSSTVQWAVTWTGITRNRDGFIGSLLDFGTNLINFDVFGFSLSLADAKWYLLTDLKWEMVEDITSAKLSSPTIRDAFVTMMASECGDAITENINESAFLAAAHGSSDNIPSTVFEVPTTTSTGLPYTPPGFSTTRSEYNNYDNLQNSLRHKTIPMPRALKRLLMQDESRVGTFTHSVNWRSGDLQFLRQSDRIRCDTYLDLMIMAFRWEAG